jgi:transcriptional regulator with XRE-family HTH domain
MRVDVNTYNKIRRFCVMEKYAQRRIAKELGINRATVAGYCRGVTLPGERKSDEPWRTPLQEVVEPLILGCLAANE